MLWNVPELDLPKPAELRACQDSGRSQNPPRGPCSLKAKCAVPLFVPLRKPYLKWHETDDFVPWSLGEMSDWGIPHVLGRCPFVIKQQVFFSALQQRGDRFVFLAGGWGQTGCLVSDTELIRGLKWFGLHKHCAALDLCDSLTFAFPRSLFDLSDGRALACSLLALPGETCEHQRTACVFISALCRFVFFICLFLRCRHPESRQAEETLAAWTNY